ncbi:protein Wnt-1-like [Styela clava]
MNIMNTNTSKQTMASIHSYSELCHHKSKYREMGYTSDDDVILQNISRRSNMQRFISDNEKLELLHHQCNNGQKSSKTKTIMTSHKKTIFHKRTSQSFLNKLSKTLLPSSSFLKIVLFAHIFFLFLQFNSCRASPKWWSIVNTPAAKPTDTHTRRQILRYPSTPSRIQSGSSNLYKTSKDSKPKDFDDILSEERIKEILSNDDVESIPKSGGFGSFQNSNQNKRDVTNNRIDDATQLATRRRQNTFHTNVGGNALTANLRPPVLVDQRVQLLNRKQRRLLRRNPGALQEIINGLRRAVKECKFQFRNRRWTCPTDIRDSSLFGKVLNRGFKETAFIYAVASAAVAHAIARGCSEGTITTCGCDEKSGEGGPGWHWGGCSDNFKFGRKFAKDFVDAGEEGQDLKFRMNLHNNEAGRQTVMEKSVRYCKCHGMSGSCTVKTCWLRTPNFKTIGRRLRDKYDAAEEVTISNHGSAHNDDDGLIPAIPGRKPPKKHDLVYFENSPSYCIKNPEFWVQGTKGRTCNATSSGYNGCESMCCGRGYRTRIRTVKQKCKCEFKWCCEVQCQICEVKKEISVCK